jgi:hypothetical protein
MYIQDIFGLLIGFPLSLSFHQCFTLIFICMLLVLEGQRNEAWKSSKKQWEGNRWVLDREVLSVFWLKHEQHEGLYRSECSACRSGRFASGLNVDGTLRITWVDSGADLHLFDVTNGSRKRTVSRVTVWKTNQIMKRHHNLVSPLSYTFQHLTLQHGWWNRSSLCFVNERNSL